MYKHPGKYKDDLVNQHSEIKRTLLDKNVLIEDSWKKRLEDHLAYALKEHQENNKNNKKNILFNKKNILF